MTKRVPIGAEFDLDHKPALIGNYATIFRIFNIQKLSITLIETFFSLASKLLTCQVKWKIFSPIYL